jgi:hypothetical protein
MSLLHLRGEPLQLLVVRRELRLGRLEPLLQAVDLLLDLGAVALDVERGDLLLDLVTKGVGRLARSRRRPAAGTLRVTELVEWTT